MKKLMIAAAIVCAAAFANAAAITWTVTDIIDAPGATEGIADGNYTLYTFITSDSSHQNDAYIQSVDAILAAFADGIYPEELAGVTYGGVDADGNAGSTSVDLTVAGAGPTTPITIHTMGLVTDSWNPDPLDPSAPVMANYQIIDFGDTVFYDTNPKNAIGTANNDWQSVPEPTSGLLLLIGVAGLALKRKRA